MTDVFRASKAAINYQQAPVPVIIAGQAIIAIRCLSLLLLANDLGYDGIADFLHRSAQAWDSTLLFFSSQLIFFLELRCALMLMRGSRRGRSIYLLTQLITTLYLWAASIGWIYPEIFSISGANNSEILLRLILHKMPDLLLLLLLFIPASSRQFFQRR